MVLDLPAMVQPPSEAVPSERLATSAIGSPTRMAWPTSPAQVNEIGRAADNGTTISFMKK